MVLAQENISLSKNEISLFQKWNSKKVGRRKYFTTTYAGFLSLSNTVSHLVASSIPITTSFSSESCFAFESSDTHSLLPLRLLSQAAETIMSGREVKCYAAMRPKGELAPWKIQRRAPGPTDICIDIKYAGICHSDIHQVREEWSTAIFPMVPGQSQIIANQSLI